MKSTDEKFIFSNKRSNRAREWPPLAFCPDGNGRFKEGRSEVLMKGHNLVRGFQSTTFPDIRLGVKILRPRGRELLPKIIGATNSMNHSIRSRIFVQNINLTHDLKFLLLL